jgi:hypothetical protein
MKLLAVLAILLVTLSPQASALANGLEFKGRGAEASFDSSDGCIYTSVNIELGENMLYSLGIHQRNVCSGQFLLEAYGFQSLSKSELRYSGNLKSATWVSTVHVEDFERGLSFDVFADLTWTGTGTIQTYHEHYNYSPYPGCHINLLIKEGFRDARVSGTISDGTTNFTPELASSGRLYNGKRFESTDGCE